MLKLTHQGSLKYLNEFERPLVVASYFGFTPVVTPRLMRKDMELVRQCHKHPHYDAGEKVAFIRTYLEHQTEESQPLCLAHRRNTGKNSLGGHTLHFIGTESGIAEATLIQGAVAILTDAGHKNLCVDLNCIGDKDVISTYEKELTNHVRKFQGNIPERLEEKMRNNIFELFHLDTPDLDEVRDSAPPAISFLSSQAREHFKEVLEYVEALGIEFRLDARLVGDSAHSSHTIFAIRNKDTKADPLAVGYRYTRLAKKAGLKKEIPMASVSIFSRENARKIRVYKNLPKPKFYLVQLGPEAKRKSLPLLDMLRVKHIRVYHHLGRDKLTAQIAGVDQTGVSHMIIIGQREALENSATVRNISTRAQETVPFQDLPRYLKSLA